MLQRLSVSTMAGVALLGASAFAQADNYEVTITNLTRNQVFSPVLVVSHRSNVHLFQAGESASPELAAIAEGGDTGPMEMLLQMTPGVADFTTSGPVPPAMSASVIVHGPALTSISVLSMLVNTNDAFLALNGERVSRWRGASVRVPAYDAGSESNNELCAEIPGPACGGAGPSPDDEGEGFIHIHNGVHGVGSMELDPAEYDWRNPVASIRIKRVH